MSKWPQVRLFDVAPSCPAKIEVSAGESVWLLNLDQVESETGEVLNKNIVDIASVGNSTCAFDEGNVLYSKLRPNLNKVVLPDGKGFCTSELLPLRPDPKKLDRHYLAHLLRSTSFVDWAVSRTDGAKMPRMKMDVFREYEIPLPTLIEQRRLVAMLDKADAIRKKRRVALELNEQFLRSAFLDMFGDPVANTKKWPTSKLGNVCRFYAGNSLPDGEIFSGQSEGILHLKVGDMNLPGNEEDVSLAREWSEKAQGGIVAPAGAVLLPKRGGAIATNKKRILCRPCALDPNLMAVAPETSLSTEYLYAWFGLFDLTTISSGSAVPQLNKGDLAPLTIQIPPEDLLNKYSIIVKKVKKLVSKCRSQLEDAENLFSALQHQAFA